MWSNSLIFYNQSWSVHDKVVLSDAIPGELRTFSYTSWEVVTSSIIGREMKLREGHSRDD